MTVITAEGSKDGKNLKIIMRYDGEVITEFSFNGQENIESELEIMAQASRTAIGGTYWPKTIPLQILAVMKNGFFDHDPEIMVEGELEEIPEPEKGVLY